LMAIQWRSRRADSSTCAPGAACRALRRHPGPRGASRRPSGPNLYFGSTYRFDPGHANGCYCPIAAVD
jgi:hypothetical protein